MLKKLPREDKEQLIVNIQQYFLDERSEEIGHLAAEMILDFMIKEIGPYLYNEAVNDAQKLLSERMLTLEDDLYALKKQTAARK